MCGERVRSPPKTDCAAGSSPRVRGTPWLPWEDPATGRFIPACAGNADRTRRSRVRFPVHPRVCGERHPAAGAGRPLSGSSPRVRGTRGGGVPLPVSGRFIPACAGNASGSVFRARVEAVHPRVCGERDGAADKGAGATGSSPRVRGTPPVLGRRSQGPRFIPACAGNASSARRLSIREPVHPRVCGERAPDRRAAPSFAGSSPRVRGTQMPCGRSRPCGRFIPACAGNATARRSWRARPSVHPRVCGERLS